MFSIVTTGARMPALGSASTFSAVTNQTIARQGDTTNGTSNGTQNKTTMTLNFSYSGPACDHFIIYGRQDYGSNSKIGTVAYAGSGNYSFTYTSFTNAYSSDNIAEGGSSPTGQTTIWDMDAVASNVSETSIGPFATQLIMPMYMGPNPAAWNSSATYRVGDAVLSGGTQYLCWTAHTNQTPPNSTFWTALTGGNYNSGVGDLSFGGIFTYTQADPTGGGSCILCNNTSTAGNVCGLQMPSGTPQTWNYGAEVGWANYIYFDLYADVSNQQMDFAIFSRAPPGDVASHVNLANFSNSGLYGGPCVANTWVTFKVPLSAGYLTTPSGGIQQVTASLSSGSFVVTALGSGPGGLDAPSWLGTPGNTTTPSASGGVWISSTPGQNGTGTYATTMGTAGTAPDAGSQTFTVKRTNFYKTAFKNKTANSWRIRNYYFARA